MADPDLPEAAIGRIGMVALLRRVPPDAEGRTVAVRLPVGFVSNLGTPRPVFAWQVLVLGAPVSLDGKACREIVVADRCLEPVSALDPAVVAELAIAGAQQDFDAALAKARHLFTGLSLTDAERDAAIARAAEQVEMQYALEQVDTGQALHDIGFRPTAPGADTLQWSGVHRGVELHVGAGPDMFGLWMLDARCVTRREAMWDERRLPPSESRGRVALTVLDFWRTAFGRDAPPPPYLDLALTFERHQAELYSLRLGLPTLYVDGEALRAIRRWLARDFGLQEGEVGPLPDRRLHLSFDNGMLRLSAGTRAYGAPACGTWMSDCAVSLRTLLATPPWLLRGFEVALERSLDNLAIGWFTVPIMATAAEG